MEIFLHVTPALSRSLCSFTLLHPFIVFMNLLSSLVLSTDLLTLLLSQEVVLVPSATPVLKALALATSCIEEEARDNGLAWPNLLGEEAAVTSSAGGWGGGEGRRGGSGEGCQGDLSRSRGGRGATGRGTHPVHRAAEAILVNRLAPSEQLIPCKE
jgi:hypothetical protein